MEPLLPRSWNAHNCDGSEIYGDIDPGDVEHREVGAGLLEEEVAPSSSMAHLYRGEAV
ncbi:hypothetical protein [Natrinema salsiterrestre]|uniref:Uncharacterized protein n=1 Tax=Natrinema salsiterrestre TaxID=2950540 RepID=A0A9Q4L521_9EURY|nr:hypothetical protein [Natrinema salsiterrestre]MDF9746998.1 hypothetical protein [Natrinema salsiterrestre]